MQGQGAGWRAGCERRVCTSAEQGPFTASSCTNCLPCPRRNACQAAGAMRNPPPPLNPSPPAPVPLAAPACAPQPRRARLTPRKCATAPGSLGRLKAASSGASSEPRGVGGPAQGSGRCASDSTAAARWPSMPLPRSQHPSPLTSALFPTPPPPPGRPRTRCPRTAGRSCSRRSRRRRATTGQTRSSSPAARPTPTGCAPASRTAAAASRRAW